MPSDQATESPRTVTRGWPGLRPARLTGAAGLGEPGAALAEGPYTAETFPVRVEDDYVVVEA